MSDDSKRFTVERAIFIVKAKGGAESKVAIHFNPVSLQYTITNTLEQGSGTKKKQFVSDSSGKLSMDLIFDTTGTGADVRGETQKVASFMKPENKVPPVVQFKWGQYTFDGMCESYKETIDFFSSDGVPLRASVSLVLATQDKVFEFATGAQSNVTGTLPGQNAVNVNLPRNRGGTGGPRSTTSVAQDAGDPSGGRDLAAANGEENMRFPEGDDLTVDDEPPLLPAIAFASGGAGLGISGGAGIAIGGSAGAGIGIGGGSSFGAGASAGFGTGVSMTFTTSVSSQLGGAAPATVSFGASAGISAGVPAVAGAFARVRAPSPPPRRRFNPDLLLQRSASVGFAAGDDVTFRVGGQATVEGASSLRTDVGQGLSLRDRIQFERG